MRSVCIAILALLPVSAFAQRASTGVGGIILIGALLAVVAACLIAGIYGPVALINKLAGRNADDDRGGKVFAVSFAVGPVCMIPLLYVFEKNDAWLAMLLGWLGSMVFLELFFRPKK